MRFSFTLFGADASFYVPLTQRAEELGFETVWLGDHVAVPLVNESSSEFENAALRPPVTAQVPYNDVWVSIGCLAGVTKRIKLGTAVYQLPLRKPFVAARAVATAQNLSDGRVIFGIGAGWIREEFEAVGEPFEARGARMDEMLDILEKLWTGQVVEHKGRWYSFPPIQFVGSPVERVPLFFGGHAKVSLERAAKRGDGWHAGLLNFEEAVRAKAILDGLRREHGRDHLPFDHYVMLEPPVTADNMRRYEDAGFEHLIAPLWAGISRTRPLQARLDNLEQFMEAVGR